MGSAILLMGVNAGLIPPTLPAPQLCTKRQSHPPRSSRHKVRKSRCFPAPAGYHGRFLPVPPKTSAERNAHRRRKSANSIMLLKSALPFRHRAHHHLSTWQRQNSIEDHFDFIAFAYIFWKRKGSLHDGFNAELVSLDITTWASSTTSRPQLKPSVGGLRPASPGVFFLPSIILFGVDPFAGFVRGGRGVPGRHPATKHAD